MSECDMEIGEIVLVRTWPHGKPLPRGWKIAERDAELVRTGQGNLHHKYQMIIEKRRKK